MSGGLVSVVEEAEACRCDVCGAEGVHPGAFRYFGYNVHACPVHAESVEKIVEKVKDRERSLWKHLPPASPNGVEILPLVADVDSGAETAEIAKPRKHRLEEPEKELEIDFGVELSKSAVVVQSTPKTQEDVAHAPSLKPTFLSDEAVKEMCSGEDVIPVHLDPLDTVEVVARDFDRKAAEDEAKNLSESNGFRDLLDAPPGKVVVEPAKPRRTKTEGIGPHTATGVFKPHQEKM